MKNYYFGLALGALVLTAIALVTLGVDPVSAHGSGLMIAEGAAAVTLKDVQALTDKLGEITKQFNAKSDELTQKADTAIKEAKDKGALAEATKAEVDKLLIEHTKMMGERNKLEAGLLEAKARLSGVEQEVATRGRPSNAQLERTIGQCVVDDENVKKFNSSTRGSVRVGVVRSDITTLTGTVGNNTSGATSLVGADRQPGIIMPPERTMTIRDLLAPGTTSQGMIEYAKETGFTNNARPVTEGATKPKSDIAFELVTAPVRTIAHIFKASRQILDDAPALRSYIDARARYGLRYAEEQELLAGDGTGQHIHGLIPQATAYSAAFTPEAESPIDKIRLAILQVFLAEFPASGIVLNPTDWARIQLTKDGQERYIIGNPQDGNTPRLWNLPVVESQAMDADEFLVGNFRMAAQIFDRLEIEVLLSTENSTDFEKNMVTLRAEERLALAVYRPEAFVHGDFGYNT
jgi:HK97 family phage major capsid protein